MIPFFQNDEICHRACDASNSEFYCNRSTIFRKRTINQFWILTRLLIIAENYRICVLDCDWQYCLKATNSLINIDLGSPITDPIIYPKSVSYLQTKYEKSISNKTIKFEATFP